MKAKIINYEIRTNENGSIAYLQMHPEGQRRVVSQQFYLNKVEQALVSKSIWINSIERQKGIPQEERTPSSTQLINYFELIEKMPRAKAIKKTDDEFNDILKSFIDETIDIYVVQNNVDGRIYTNYQPYEPTTVESEDELEFDETSLAEEEAE